MSFHTPDPDQPCPCCSGLVFSRCCAPLLAGELAPSPETLMRSRFTAFATGNRDYLLHSWHPDTRPDELELDSAVEFTRLIIHESSFPVHQDKPATVWFTAVYRTGGRKGRQCEKSVFVTVDGEWKYLGEAPPTV